MCGSQSCRKLVEGELYPKQRCPIMQKIGGGSIAFKAETDNGVNVLYHPNHVHYGSGKSKQNANFLSFLSPEEFNDFDSGQKNIFILTLSMESRRRSISFALN
jgi:hypothetical protein